MTESTLVALALPMLKVVLTTKASETNAATVAATDFCQAVIIHSFLCFFLSFLSFLPRSSEGSQDRAGASVVAGTDNQNQ